MKVVINKCFGGFGLSPAALIECYARGMVGIAMPVGDYYAGSEKAVGDIVRWRSWLAGEVEKGYDAFLTVFSPCEKFVLYNPETRVDRILVALVEDMGERAWGTHAKLKVVEIPDGVGFTIDEYDGMEHIVETHRTWG